MTRINPFEYIDDITIKAGQSSVVTLVPKKNADLLTVGYVACNVQRAFANLRVEFYFNGAHIIVDDKTTMGEITARYRECVMVKHLLRRCSRRTSCGNKSAL